MLYLLIAVVFFRDTHAGDPPVAWKWLPPRTRPGTQLIVTDTEMAAQIESAATAIGSDVGPLVYAFDSLVRTAYGASRAEILDMLTLQQIHKWQGMHGTLMSLVARLTGESSCPDIDKAEVERYVCNLVGISDSGMDPQVILGAAFGGDGLDRGGVFLHAISATESFSVECVIEAYAHVLNPIILRYLASALGLAQTVSQCPRHVIMFGHRPDDDSGGFESIRRTLESGSLRTVTDDMVAFAQQYPVWIDSLGQVDDDELMNALDVPTEFRGPLTNYKNPSRFEKLRSEPLIPSDTALEDTEGRGYRDLNVFSHDEAAPSEPNTEAYVDLFRAVKTALAEWRWKLAEEVHRRASEASVRS